MNKTEQDTSNFSMGGFPSAEASMGVWVATRNGDTFVPVPAVVYAGDMLFTAAARGLRRIMLSLVRFIESRLPEPVVLEAVPVETNAPTAVSARSLATTNSKAA
ncbi:MAG: hypothetical protein K1Y02_05790 [Candidatus Hydrogenedentes bacterium]|nr:hypothetical protein [Candidatus Hydrogenedentota bacterium]